MAAPNINGGIDGDFDTSAEARGQGALRASLERQKCHGRNCRQLRYARACLYLPAPNPPRPICKYLFKIMAGNGRHLVANQAETIVPQTICLPDNGLLALSAFTSAAFALRLRAIGGT